MSFEGVLALVSVAVAGLAGAFTLWEETRRRRERERSLRLVPRALEHVHQPFPSTREGALDQVQEVLGILQSVTTLDYATDPEIREHVDNALAWTETRVHQKQDDGASDAGM